MILRNCQKKAIQTTLEGLTQGASSALWVMPTGSGKTAAFTELARMLSMPTLVYVHREELIEQTVDHFLRQWPAAKVGVIKAQRNEWYFKDVVVASVQSMTTRRLAEIPKDTFGVVIVDECQHLPATGWTRAVKHFDAGLVQLVTATPDRLDGKGLGEWVGDGVVYSYSLRQAIEDKCLVPIRQFAIVTDADLGGVSVRGDFVTNELALAVNTPERNGCIVSAYKEHIPERRAVVFAVDIQHSADLALAFNEGGITASFVSGSMPSEDRRSILEQFRKGKIRVVVNCQILTEGWDDPDVEAVIMARPTKSRAFYTQAIGRGLRLPKHNPAKVDCVVLDITDNCRRHKLVTALDLMGRTKKKDANGEDILAILVEEEAEEQEKQEQILDDIKAPVHWRLESICPWPGLPNLVGYTPSSPWHNAPASEKQIGYLKKFGLDIRDGLTKGEVSWLIEQCKDYEEAFPSPATEKQEWFLRMNGAWEEGLTKRKASQRIVAVKKAHAELTF